MPPRRPRLARISITLPRAVLAAADQLAARLDRSRSWVIAEAVRRFGEDQGGVSKSDLQPGGVGVVRATTIPPTGGLGDYRLEQLRADLRLTPEERVRAGQEQLRLAQLLRPSTRADRILAFERYEDYVDWKRKEGAIS